MKSVKRALLCLTATMLTFSAVGLAARERQDIVLESPAGAILAHPSVADLVAKASKMRRPLYIDRILLSDEIANRTHFCIELKWSGGDVSGTFGSIRGEIEVNSAGGRGGVSYQIVNTQLKLASQDQPGYPACVRIVSHL